MTGRDGDGDGTGGREPPGWAPIHGAKKSTAATYYTPAHTTQQAVGGGGDTATTSTTPTVRKNSKKKEWSGTAKGGGETVATTRKTTSHARHERPDVRQGFASLAATGEGGSDAGRLRKGPQKKSATRHQGHDTGGRRESQTRAREVGMALPWGEELVETAGRCRGSFNSGHCSRTTRSGHLHGRDCATPKETTAAGCSAAAKGHAQELPKPESTQQLSPLQRSKSRSTSSSRPSSALRDSERLSCAHGNCTTNRWVSIVVHSIRPVSRSTRVGTCWLTTSCRTE